MSENDASRIVIDYSSVAILIVASLTDDFRGVIYNCYMFIVHATVLTFLGSMIANRSVPKSCVGRVFNSKLSTLAS